MNDFTRSRMSKSKRQKISNAKAKAPEPESNPSSNPTPGPSGMKSEPERSKPPLSDWVHSRLSRSQPDENVGRMLERCYRLCYDHVKELVERASENQVILDFSLADYLDEFEAANGKRIEAKFPPPPQTGPPRVVDSPNGVVYKSKDGYPLLIHLPGLHRVVPPAVQRRADKAFKQYNMTGKIKTDCQRRGGQASRIHLAPGNTKEGWHAAATHHTYWVGQGRSTETGEINVSRETYGTTATHAAATQRLHQQLQGFLFPISHALSLISPGMAQSMADLRDAIEKKDPGFASATLHHIDLHLSHAFLWNAQTGFHLDAQSSPYVLDVVCTLGDYKGGHFYVSPLNSAIKLEPYDGLFLLGSIMGHAICKVSGKRRGSIAGFVNHYLFKRFDVEAKKPTPFAFPTDPSVIVRQPPFLPEPLEDNSYIVPPPMMAKWKRDQEGTALAPSGLDDKREGM